jgi:uracil-DNA glycosylase family 4
MPTPKPLTPWRRWELHCKRWENGCGADICERARKVCLARGSIPADVAFVGEGPGASENLIGKTFVGPAGKHLQRYVIEKAIPHHKVPIAGTKDYKKVPSATTYILLNLVGCVPTDEHSNKDGAPDQECIDKCAPRLLEILAICNPKLIVCVGKEAESALDPWLKASVWSHWPEGAEKHPCYKTPQIRIIHPSSILRQNISNRGLMFQSAALEVEQAIETYVHGGRKEAVRPSGGSDDTGDPIPF